MGLSWRGERIGALWLDLCDASDVFWKGMKFWQASASNDKLEEISGTRVVRIIACIWMSNF